MKRIIVAIDGYSGTGKSSTAQLVAEGLNYTYIDSGAMYRAITFHFLRNNVDLTNPKEIEESMEKCELRFNELGILLNGELIENEIRSMVVNQNVSEVSAISSVRRKLVEQQREMSRNKGVVMDGRDIGTVVFPEAELKLFMTAQMGVRVKRRKKQLAKKGIIEYDEAIEQNLAKRDEIDTTRSDSPLKQATDAIVIDTSDLTLNEQVKKIVNLANNLIYEN